MNGPSGRRRRLSLLKLGGATGVMALLATAAGCGAESEAGGGDDDVVIAAPLSLTGAAAAYGLGFERGMNFTVDWINDHGGIKSMDGRKIKLEVSDTQSDPQQAVRLIREAQGSGAVGTVGPISSAEAFASLATIKQLKFPFMSASADSALADEGGGYAFRVLPSNDEVVAAAADFLQTYVDAGEIEINRIGALTASAAPGPAYEAGWEKQAAEQGWEFSSYTYNPAEVKSFDSVVQQMKSDGVDTVVGLTYPQDSLIFVQAVASQSWRPENGFFFQFGGPPTKSFREAANQNALNWLSVPYYAAGSGCPEQQEFLTAFEEEYGSALDELSALGASLVAGMYGALEEAGEATSEAVTEALKNLKTDECGLAPLPGGLEIDEDGNNRAWAMPVIQNEGSPLVPVLTWPEEVATRAPTWPAHDLAAE